MQLEERYLVDAQGKPVAVVLDIEVFRQILSRLQQLEAGSPLTPDEVWQQHWQAFLSRARSHEPLRDSALSRESIYGDS